MIIFDTIKSNKTTMKQLIQNTGLLIFIIGIIVLLMGLLTETENNNMLLISGILLIGGLVVHVILNKKFI